MGAYRDVPCKLKAPGSETIDAIETKPFIAVDVGHFSFSSRTDIECHTFAFVAATGKNARNGTQQAPLLDA